MRVQARIAAVNTALTALGMWAMAIPGIGLLSMFVFICSFIPIAGVFVSTVPIAFVALTEYGFIKARRLNESRQARSQLDTSQQRSSMQHIVASYSTPPGGAQACSMHF